MLPHPVKWFRNHLFPSWFCCILLLLSPQMFSDSLLTVKYARPESDQDSRYKYYVGLLELVLQKSGQPYRLEPAKWKMQQGRALARLKQGEGIDVFWSMTDKERERELRPIRIPLLKGLIGIRLLLIREQDRQKFATIREKAQLQALIAGQGHDWPDLEILRANQFKVVPSASYEGLFKMLEKGRIDYFPRAVSEIWPEARTHADKGLVAEDSLVIHYPAAIYFFVNKKNEHLAAVIESGLQKAIGDGSFERYFQKHFRNILDQSRLNHRTWIHLENPLLPPETPISDRKLWHLIK